MARSFLVSSLHDQRAAVSMNVDLYVDNVFDEVAIGRVLSSPFGFDLTLSAAPRVIGMGFSVKLRV
jgi:hypothetical protein